MSNPIEAAEPLHYDIPAAKIPEALDRIEKANRRLVRNGIPGQFILDIERYLEEVTDPVTKLVSAYERARLTLNVPALKLAGYTFMATLVLEPGGMITRNAPGQSLDGWVRPAEHLCQHCGTVRHRVKSYVIRDDHTRDLFQVGSNCLAAFLGVKPSGLWLLEFDFEDLAVRSESSGGGYVPTTYHVRSVLALGWAISDGGKAFVTRGQAEERETTSTSDLILAVWNHVPSFRDQAFTDYVREMIAQAAQIEEETPEIVDAIILELDTIRPDSDYGMNLHTAIQGEFVSGRSLALVASLIAVHMRNTAKRREAAAAPVAKGFIGEPKDKFADITATVRTTMVIPGHYGDKLLVIFQAESGHLLKWMSSKVVDLDAGKTYKIAGTVKDQINYRGDDQTVVERVKFTEITA